METTIVYWELYRVILGLYHVSQCFMALENAPKMRVDRSMVGTTKCAIKRLLNP